MKTKDFNFELPEELIAQHPPLHRGNSRLLVLQREKRSLEHRMVGELPAILEKGTLMVFNNSRVRRARLIGLQEETEAKVEFLLLNNTDETKQVWRSMVQRAKRRRIGSRYLFTGRLSADGKIADNLIAEIVAEDGDFRIIKFDKPIDDAWLDINGHVPLPPYIKRDDSKDDAERYQTVYAREYGSAAAPTAGLHFTNELLGELEKAGIETAFITLHVGLGTFLPVRSEEVEAHKMHDEAYNIDDETACRIEKAKSEGRKILAVGTTSVRTLESAWLEDTSKPGCSELSCEHSGKLKRGEGTTSIFIYPGYIFKVVDMMFTNFHTPTSSLLMLVSAFVGREFVLDAYKEAIREGYRFFSYGDACLIQ